MSETVEYELVQCLDEDWSGCNLDGCQQLFGGYRDERGNFKCPHCRLRFDPDVSFRSRPKQSEDDLFSSISAAMGPGGFPLGGPDEPEPKPQTMAYILPFDDGMLATDPPKPKRLRR